MNFCFECANQNSEACKMCITSKSPIAIPSHFISAKGTGEMESLPELSFKEDLVNKPSHYHKNEIDVNGYLEKHFPKEPSVTVAEGFYIGNVIKYVSRYKEKNGLQDLEKGLANLKFLIDLEKKRRE